MKGVVWLLVTVLTLPSHVRAEPQISPPAQVVGEKGVNPSSKACVQYARTVPGWPIEPKVMSFSVRSAKYFICTFFAHWNCTPAPPGDCPLYCGFFAHVIAHSIAPGLPGCTFFAHCIAPGHPDCARCYAFFAYFLNAKNKVQKMRNLGGQMQYNVQKMCNKSAKNAQGGQAQYNVQKMRKKMCKKMRNVGGQVQYNAQ